MYSRPPHEVCHLVKAGTHLQSVKGGYKERGTPFYSFKEFMCIPLRTINSLACAAGGGRRRRRQCVEGQGA